MDKKVNASLLQLCSLLTPYEEHEFSQKDTNWEQIIHLAKQHRVTPILSRLLNDQKIEIPPEAKKKLESQSKSVNFKMLKLTAELLRLTKEFDQERIQFISLKGPVQSLQIFGDISIKHSRDLDILIEESKVEQCLVLLKKMGYQTSSFYLTLNKRQKRYFLKSQNQLLFFHPERKVQLEVHWRLFANKAFLEFPFHDLLSNAETVMLENYSFKSVGKLHLINYLLAHGAKHQWSMLYWVVEILHFLKNNSISLEQLYSESKKQNVHRPFLQFLGLAQKLFSFKIPRNIESELDKFQISKLVSNALEAIQTDSEKLREKSFILYCKKVFYQMSLKRELSYKLGSLNWISVNDFQTLNLPQELFFLYYPLRPFLWCKRYLFS